MRALLDRLLGRRPREAEAAPPPPTELERRKLDRERRLLERQLRQMSKRLRARGCATCPTAEDPVGVALWKRRGLVAERLSRVESRLED